MAQSIEQAVLLAGGWSGTQAPYRQTVPVSIVQSKTVDGYVGLSEGITSEQWYAAALARLRKTDQGGGTVTIVADGVLPSVDIPITVTLSGLERLEDLENRMDYLENAVQGDGGYVSKYGGEEIDALLDRVAAQTGGV